MRIMGMASAASFRQSDYRLCFAENGRRWRMLDARFGNFAVGNVPAVPEPTSWTLMIAGLGITGAVLRSGPSGSQTKLALRPSP
jgi:hypothetical protein